MTDMKIVAYRLYPNDRRVRIAAGERDRRWMDETQESYAYRCLPLNIANQHGWAVYPAKEIKAIWTGGSRIEDIDIFHDGEGIAASAFGHGVLTFHILHVIKLPPQYNLHISGAPNIVKRGIVPLTGIYEADWAPFSFTMNWKFTEPDMEVRFPPEEPICFFFPVQRNLIERFDFAIEDIREAPALAEEHRIWNAGRTAFLKDLDKQDGSWQKHYFQGRLPSGGACPVDDHKTKLKLSDPKKS